MLSSSFLIYQKFYYYIGDNSYGQLGSTKTGNITKVERPIKISNISSSSYHSLLLDNKMSAWASGNNSRGQLGLGCFKNVSEFTKIEKVKNIVQVSCGSIHSFFLDIDGNLFSCGSSTNGQLGLNNYIDTCTPTKIPNINTKIVSISCGVMHSVFLDSDGFAWSCGDNMFGQLGSDYFEKSNTFTKIPNISCITSICCGGFHTLFLDISGSVWGTGSNSHGQLGIDFNIKKSQNQMEYIKTPQKILCEELIKYISAGDEHSVILDIHNKIWTSGNNYWGQLGLDDTNYYNFTKVDAVDNIVSIICDEHFTILLDYEENLWFSGKNNFFHLESCFGDYVDRFTKIENIKAEKLGNSTKTDFELYKNVKSARKC